jgi:hypothetical protein
MFQVGEKHWGMDRGKKLIRVFTAIDWNFDIYVDRAEGHAVT